MTYIITGTVDGPIRPRRARTLEIAAAKAQNLRESGIRDVRVLQGDGTEVDAEHLEATYRTWFHKRKVKNLRKWAHSVIWTPLILTGFIPILALIDGPQVIVEYWNMYLFLVVIPCAIGFLLLRRARTLSKQPA